MEHIILLHGLGSHGLTMSLFKAYILNTTHYNVICPTYQSLFFKTVHEIGDEVIDCINRQISIGDEIHFIGHSLGGIVARFIADDKRLLGVTKTIVTLGTPHHGAILANKVLNKFCFISNLCPIVEELSVGSDFIAKLPTPNVKYGVIIGTSYEHIADPLIWLGNKFLRDINVHDGIVEEISNILSPRN